SHGVSRDDPQPGAGLLLQLLGSLGQLPGLLHFSGGEPGGGLGDARTAVVWREFGDPLVELGGAARIPGRTRRRGLRAEARELPRAALAEDGGAPEAGFGEGAMLGGERLAVEEGPPIAHQGRAGNATGGHAD